MWPCLTDGRRARHTALLGGAGRHQMLDIAREPSTSQAIVKGDDHGSPLLAPAGQASGTVWM